MARPLILGASGTDAAVTCIVVHGRGQTPDDMVRMITSRLDVAGARFVLPKSVGVGWYGARAVDPLTDVTRAELVGSMAVIAGLVAQSSGPLVLAGFSQGACLLAEYLLRQGRGPVSAACLLTGCRVGTVADDLPSVPLPGLAVYASGGDTDPWIPADDHHTLLGDLTRAGARVRSDMFPGRAHEVTGTEVATLGAMLRRAGSGHPMFEGDHDGAA